MAVDGMVLVGGMAMSCAVGEAAARPSSMAIDVAVGLGCVAMDVAVGLDGAAMNVAVGLDLGMAIGLAAVRRKTIRITTSVANCNGGAGKTRRDGLAHDGHRTDRSTTMSASN